MRLRHRHQRHGLRWLAASAGLAVAGATVLAMAPAHAAPTTVNAQLSLSGVATKADVLGGTTIGVHPGDTVDFHASPLPTAGLDNIPALGPLLDGALSKLLGSQFQVVVSFGDNVPGVAGTSVRLGGPTSGSCKGAPDVAVTFSDAATYSFTWTVQYVLPSLFGCTRTSLGATSLNQLEQAGIAINASNQWVGQIVVSTDPPKGGISVQLPGVGAAPSLPVIGQLPGVTLPPVNTPTLPVGGVSIPGLGGGASGGTSAVHKPSTGTTTSGPKFRMPALTVPEMVVPKGYGNGPGTVSGGDAGSGPDGLGNLGVLGDVAGNNAGHSGGTASGKPAIAPAPAVRISAPAELAAGTTSNGGKQMPRVLAIAAIIALALVTGLYAQAFLLRKK